MKLRPFIINIFGFVIIILLLIQIYKYIYNGDYNETNVSEDNLFALNNEEQPSISLFDTPLSYEYINYSHTGRIYEPFDPPPMLSSGMNKASVTTIDNMRTFLELMWTLTSKDEIKDASYNFCNRFGELSSGLPSAIRDLRKLSKEDIYNLYSASAIPKPNPMTPPIDTPPIPIIQNNGDYIKLLSLCVRSTFLPPFVLPSVNIHNKLDRQKGKLDARNLGVVDCANQLFIPIADILNYFHNQYKNNNNSSPGDTAETASLNLHDSCASNGTSYRVREFRQAKTYDETAPAWAKFIQVLVIGSGGGGGGGAQGCDTGKRGKNSSGGGGAASGNSGAIAFTTQKIQIEPSSKYKVIVGAGGVGGDIAFGNRGSGPKSNGGRGQDTVFSINGNSITVIGANGGSSGAPGYCGGNGARDVYPYPILQPAYINGNFNNVTITKNSILGNIGKLGITHWHRIWDTVGGQNGKAVFIDNLTELKLPNYSFLKIQKKYGYGGQGGEGQTRDTSLENAKAGGAGGKGYVCVFFFAQ